MIYEKFAKILNEGIFEDSKNKLLLTIADNPDRYTGLFRPTKPKAKIMQNLLQSNEIKFGDAFELIIREYFVENNYETLPLSDKHNGDSLNFDQLFKKENTIIFIEQKIRDDHDSTKKRGQIDNFTKKIDKLIEKYPNMELKCFFYFVDDSLSKNFNYYQKEIDNLRKDYGISVDLKYGRDLFDMILPVGTWDELISHLKEWKKDIPEFPEINFDIKSEIEYTYNKIIETFTPSEYRKLFENESIVNEIFPIIFPENAILKKLLEYFKDKSKESKNSKIYASLYNKLNTILNG